MMITANDGTLIHSTGTSVICSNGETYLFADRTLVGPHRTISMNVSSMAEAVGIVSGKAEFIIYLRNGLS